MSGHVNDASARARDGVPLVTPIASPARSGVGSVPAVAALVAPPIPTASAGDLAGAAPSGPRRPPGAPRALDAAVQEGPGGDRSVCPVGVARASLERVFDTRCRTGTHPQVRVATQSSSAGHRLAQSWETIS